MDKSQIETLATLFSVLSGIVFVILAIIKARPEAKKVEAESEDSESSAKEHEANAAERALKTTEIATQQYYATMKDLIAERQKRRELEKRVEELENQLAKQAKDFEAQKLMHQEEFDKVKRELEYTVSKQDHKIALLVGQVEHLGATPITGK